MRIFSCCLACLLGLALGGTASAQVYESRDAQGNPVFSDKPSAGAEVVKVPPTNSADPVADAPDRPEPAAAPRPGTGAAAPDRRANNKDDDDDPYFYYGGADVDEEEARERREEARERREQGADRPDGERPPRADDTPRRAPSRRRRGQALAPPARIHRLGPERRAERQDCCQGRPAARQPPTVLRRPLASRSPSKPSSTL